MPPARAPRRQPPSFPGYQATAGTRAEQTALDVLPGHPLARHIDDFLADLANANKPRNTIRAYRTPAGGRGRYRGGAGRDLLPAAAQGRAPRRAARPGAVRDRLRLRRPRLGGLRDLRRGPGP